MCRSQDERTASVNRNVQKRNRYLSPGVNWELQVGRQNNKHRPPEKHPPPQKVPQGEQTTRVVCSIFRVANVTNDNSIQDLTINFYNLGSKTSNIVSPLVHKKEQNLGVVFFIFFLTKMLNWCHNYQDETWSHRCKFKMRQTPKQNIDFLSKVALELWKRNKHI